MATPETKPSYPAVPPQGVPPWFWGVLGCGCLPLIFVFVLGIVLAPMIRARRDSRREEVRSSTCMNNVRQSTAAIMMYAQDYDERYPMTAHWMDDLPPYLARGNSEKIDSMLRCPTIQKINPAGYGYALNAKLAGKSSAKITAPALSRLIYDSSNLARNASDEVTSLPSPPRHSKSTRGKRLETERVNIMGYADGHVKALSQSGSQVSMPNDE